MKIKVYDWYDKVTELVLPDKEIQEINVRVLSGDETGTVTFTDGTKVEFDASDCRYHDFYDGSYSVTGDDIKKWINFVRKNRTTVSYQRMRIFS